MNGLPERKTAIPAHWTWKKIKYLASLRSGETITSDSISDSGDYPVYGGNGLRGYTSSATHRGDYVLIGRQGALCGNINYASGEFWASEHAVVVDTRGKFNIRWLGEVLRSMDLNQYSQSAAQPGLSVDVIANLEIPVPPLGEQRAVADYLKRELQQLDVLVAAKDRMLELLAEKRQALIARAVTRGLNLNTPLRDSGLPWLGQIPVHWNTERSKWLFRERDERSLTGEEEMLTVSHLTGVTPRSEKDVNMFEAETNEGYKVCYPGDLVINTLWAWMGAMGVVPVHGIVSPAYHVYEPGSRLDPAYVDALVRITVFAQEATRFSKGVWSSRLRLYLERRCEPPVSLRQVDPLIRQLTLYRDLIEEKTKETNE